MNFLSSAFCVTIDAPLFAHWIFVPDIAYRHQRMTFQKADLTLLPYLLLI